MWVSPCPEEAARGAGRAAGRVTGNAAYDTRAAPKYKRKRAERVPFRSARKSARPCARARRFVVVKISYPQKNTRLGVRQAGPTFRAQSPTFVVPKDRSQNANRT